MAIVCLAGITVVPSFAHRSTYTSYGEWLRTQVRGDVDDNFERALANAVSDRAPSLGHFLQTFVDTFAEQADPIELSSVFGVDGLDGTLLVSYLQSRFSGLSPDALPVRTLLTIPSTTALSGSDRYAPSGDTGSDHCPGRLVAVGDVPSSAVPQADVRRLLTSMPRLGP